MVSKSVLTDTARRTWRTFIQSFVYLAGVLPAVLIALNQFGADIFGIDSLAYQKLVAFGAGASILFGAFVRFYLAIEKKFPALEVVRKHNEVGSEAVAVVEVKDGVVQDSQVISRTDLESKIDPDTGSITK